MIQAKGVCLTYPDGTTALKDVNFEIKPGEIVYVTGPSGAGKTSLLKLLMGMEYPTSGSLKVLGQPIAKGQGRHIRRLRRLIGPVFQELRLIKGRSALENVMLGMRFLGHSPGQIKGEATDALIRVGLEHKTLSLVENLSWGESQRVAIARALARKPALILADEPTGNLDKDNALNILELLSSFKEERPTVIITTHATHLLNESSNHKFIHVEEGKLYWEGTR